jgi:hypothetical protein
MVVVPRSPRHRIEDYDQQVGSMEGSSIPYSEQREHLNGFRRCRCTIASAMDLACSSVLNACVKVQSPILENLGVWHTTQLA